MTGPGTSHTAGGSPRSRRSVLTAGTLSVAAVALAACGGGKKAGRSPIETESTPASEWHGTLLKAPFVEPDVTLTDTAGKPFSLRGDTRGKALTLIYFGYTHCPDVCPTTMSDLGQAVKSLPAAVRAKIAVVFITTDPWRDNPAVIGSWLRSFDTTFIGLTGPFAKIQQAAKQVAISVLEPTTRSGNYEVNHGAEVLAFGPDHLARLIYTSGVLPEEYAADLPKLVTRGTTGWGSGGS